MKKQLVLLLLASFVFAGCQLLPSTPPTNEPPQTRFIMDQRAKTVTIPTEVKRIAAIPMPAASMIAVLDRGVQRLVGMNPSALAAAKSELLETMYPEVSTVATGFTNPAFEVNVEELLTLTPDVVFQWGDRGEGLYAGMEQVGIPVVGLSYGTQDDLITWIRLMGTVLHTEGRAEELITYHETTLTEIAQKTASFSATTRPKVLYLPYGKELKTNGRNTYNHMYIELVGGQNVAQDLEGTKTVTMEQIITWNPDIIILGNFADTKPADLYTNSIPGQSWRNVAAVKNKKVYRAPLGTYRWDPPNQESPLMWLWLGTIVQPEVFTDSIRQSTTDFFLRFYDYTLSSQQLDMVLQCDEYQTLPRWCKTQ